MSSIIDVIGALIASTVIIITIILTIINVQKIKYNTETMLNLYQSGDLIASGLDLEYLEKVGRNLYNDEVAVTRATANEFVFRTRENRADAGMKIVRIFTTAVAGTTNTFRLQVSVNGLPPEFDSSPVFIQSGDIFTYFDGSDPPVITTAEADIHSVQVNLTFLAPAWNEDPSRPNLEYPLTFWRFFKNAYIDNPRP